MHKSKQVIEKPFNFYIRRTKDNSIHTTVKMKNSRSAYPVLLGMFGRCHDRVNYYVDFSEAVNVGAIDPDTLQAKMKRRNRMGN